MRDTILHRGSTIKDVATEAGVSTATVSNVLQGKATLYTSDTAEKVWCAVRTLNYRPNQVARSLVRRKTHTLGVVVERPHGRLTRNSYMSVMLDGVLEIAVNAGYQIKIISLLMSDSSSALTQLEDGSVDGIALFAPLSSTPLVEWAQNTHVPVVIAGSTLPGTGLPCVDVENEEAMYKAVCWLIEIGHRRIGLIGGHPGQASACEREQGFLRALEDAGIEVCPTWRFEGDYSSPSGERGALELIKVAPRLTAIVCANDGMALGALTSLKQQGIQVPKQISLMGFDDLEPARWVQPMLTTVRQPVAEIGMKAAELLIARIETGARLEGITLLGGELVRRESVAPYS